MSAIAFVTCRVLPEPDPDQDLLLEACRAAGVDVEMVPWDDSSVDWGRFRAAILRSCWNYHEDPAGFEAWIRDASRQTTLINGQDLVLWNLDKRYLVELEAAGIEIVPTKFVSNLSDFETVLQKSGWNDIVVKPSISAGSFMTKRFGIEQSNEAHAFVDEILKTRNVIVQPFMASVEDGGEVALVHIAGALTHGVVKEPRFEGNDESVSVAFVPVEAQRRAAEKVLEGIPPDWLYVRVDLMLSAEGTWLLSELELLEPSLFFLQHRGALDRFVAAISQL